MSESLYTISYFSRSNLKGSIEEVAAEVYNILKIAVERNSNLNVTGALLYSGGYFVQVLEGPEENVEEIFESIQNDIRHCDVSVINNGYLQKRSFSTWSMALAGVNNDLLPEVEGILNTPKEIQSSSKGATTVQLLSGLVKRYEEEKIWIQKFKKFSIFLPLLFYILPRLRSNSLFWISLKIKN